MRYVKSSRACAVLYNTLIANNICGSVLMPANICETVPATYIKAGLKCQFCDISTDDWQIDKEKAINIIRNSNISVFHHNHTYGYISDGDNQFLNDLKVEFPNLFIVDDRCLCFPSKKIDTDADLTLYSTGKVKCIDIGWGGIGVLSDGYKYSQIRIQYNSIDEERFDKHVKTCHNERIEVDYSILKSNWLEISDEYPDYYERVSEKMETTKEHKERINSIYSCIPGSMDISYCDWRYQLLIENAEECKRALFSQNLFCSSHYKSLGDGYFDDTQTPNCEYLEAHILNLFNDFRFTEDQAKRATEILCGIAKPVKNIRF